MYHQRIRSYVKETHGKVMALKDCGNKPLIVENLAAMATSMALDHKQRKMLCRPPVNNLTKTSPATSCRAAHLPTARCPTGGSARAAAAPAWRRNAGRDSQASGIAGPLVIPPAKLSFPMTNYALKREQQFQCITEVGHTVSFPQPCAEKIGRSKWRLLYSTGKETQRTRNRDPY